MTIIQQLADILAAADCHKIPAVYAGIGAGRTPYSIAPIIRRIGTFLDEQGWMLR